MKEAQIWAPAGFRIAEEQFLVKESSPVKVKEGGYRPRLSQKDNSVRVSGRGFSLEINAGDGSIVSWKIKGAEQLCGPFEPYFWKPANDN